VLGSHFARVCEWQVSEKEKVSDSCCFFRTFELAGALASPVGSAVPAKQQKTFRDAQRTRVHKTIFTWDHTSTEQYVHCRRKQKNSVKTLRTWLNNASNLSIQPRTVLQWLRSLDVWISQS